MSQSHVPLISQNCWRHKLWNIKKAYKTKIGDPTDVVDCTSDEAVAACGEWLAPTTSVPCRLLLKFFTWNWSFHFSNYWFITFHDFLNYMLEIGIRDQYDGDNIN